MIIFLIYSLSGDLHVNTPHLYSQKTRYVSILFIFSLGQWIIMVDLTFVDSDYPFKKSDDENIMKKLSMQHIALTWVLHHLTKPQL